MRGTSGRSSGSNVGWPPIEAAEMSEQFGYSPTKGSVDGQHRSS